MTQKINVLISSVGRRGQMVDCWKRSLDAFGVGGQILGVDCSRSAPARYLVDRFFEVPPCTSSEFLKIILEICREQKISLVIPTIDTELPIYAAHRHTFEAEGTGVAVSSPEAVAIGGDKVMTCEWLVAHGFPTVRQATPEEVLRNPADWHFPLVLKPRCGSASVGVRWIHSAEMLKFAAADEPNAVVQERAAGVEYTINALVSQSGQCICSVPHRRCEVRAGEVSKGVTVKHRPLMDLAARIVEKLPGAFGVLNLQAFLSSSAEIQVIEINPRFGGGFPLAYQAGADFPRWMIEELLGLPSTARFDGWEDSLAMLRYDTAVFLPAKNLGDLC